MSGAANVLIKIGANAGQAIGEIGRVNKALGDQMTASEKASTSIKRAAVPAGVALAALGAAAISCARAAAEDEAAQVKLAGVLKRTAGATNESVAAAEDYISKLALATGVADDELRPALAKLATATGDVKKAQEGLAIALDVSAATGKTTDQVSKALAKAYAGNGAALAKLIPGIDEAAVKSGDFNRINKELARLTGGAAADAANTAAGQYKRFQLALSETQEQIGTALLPVLNELTPILVTVSQYALNNTDAIVALAAAVGAVAGLIVTANVALKIYETVSIAAKAATIVWTAAQWLLNAALTANPIGLVVVAIAALAAGLIIAYRESETFRGIVNTAFAAIKTGIDTALQPFIDHWDSIKSAINFVWDLLKRFWPILLPGGAFYLAINAIEDKFGLFQGAIDLVKSAFDKVETSVETVKTKLDDLWTKASTVMSNFKAAIRDYLTPLAAAFKLISDLVKSIADNIGKISLPSSLGNIASALGIGKRSASISTAARSSTTVNVTINGPIDSDSTARELLKVLGDYDIRYAIA
ncbi:MAG: hypothetical protein ACR2JV_01965 [Gaiellales bacterium]